MKTPILVIREHSGQWNYTRNLNAQKRHPEDQVFQVLVSDPYSAIAIWQAIESVKTDLQK